MGMGPIILEYQARIMTLHATASQLRSGQIIALAITIAASLPSCFLGSCRWLDTRYGYRQR